MLTLQCPPYCGVMADETELHAEGEAHITRFGPPGSSDEDFETYLFERKNPPKGVHFERWRHTGGCGKFFHAARSTMTLEVYATYSAQTLEPPQDVIDAIKAKHPPDWEGYK